MCSGIVLNRWKSLDLDTLRDKLRGAWWLVTLIAIGGLALAGVPVFATFVGKAIIDRAADDAGLSWLPFLLLLARCDDVRRRAAGARHDGIRMGPAAGHAGESEPETETPETSGGMPVVMLLTASALLVACAALAFAPGAHHRTPVGGAALRGPPAQARGHAARGRAPVRSRMSRRNRSPTRCRSDRRHGIRACARGVRAVRLSASRAVAFGPRVRAVAPRAAPRAQRGRHRLRRVARRRNGRLRLRADRGGRR